MMKISKKSETEELLPRRDPIFAWEFDLTIFGIFIEIAIENLFWSDVFEVNSADRNEGRWLVLEWHKGSKS